MKNIILFLIVSFSILSCDKRSKIIGKFESKDYSMPSTITIDEKTVDMKQLGAGKYQIEDGKIYVENPAGTFIFEIVDDNTIKGISHWVKGNTYIKKK